MSIKKVHIVNAHQKWSGIAEGNLTRHYIDIMSKVLDNNQIEYTIINVDDGYDIEEEVGRFVAADLIILQFPMYWMGLPWLGKKYIDEVFMAGTGRIYNKGYHESSNPNKQYGRGKGLLSGKYMLSITCSAPLESFVESQQFFNGLGVDNAFMSVHNALRFVGLSQIETFTSHNIFKNPQIEADSKNLERLLIKALNN